MRSTYRVILMAALLFPLGAQARAGNVDTANQQTRQFIGRTMDALRIPGLQIAVIQDGKVVLSESHGLANVENGLPATRTTRFPLNSATKSFTGVAMMQLAEAGKVNLDAPISTYLADLPEAWRGVRVRQLLAHTSGLPDILDAQGLLGGGSEQAAWAAVTRLPVEAAPGARFTYNQTNYVLLARIIAAQSSIPYDRYVATRQFDVAGMPSTTFGDSYDLIANSATIYTWFPRRTDAPDAAPRLSHWFYDMTPGLWAGGGMLTTADDVAQWLVALSGNRLINAASTRRMWTPERLNDGREGAWGDGWAVLQGAPQRQVAGMGGARSAFIVYPDQGLAIVVLTNLVGANPQNFIPQIAAFYGVDAPVPTVSRAARPSPAGSRR